MVDIIFDPPISFDDALRPMTNVPSDVLEAFADLDVIGAEDIADRLGMDDPRPVVLFALRCGATLRGES
jgi:hypothetical protein